MTQEEKKAIAKLLCDGAETLYNKEYLAWGNSSTCCKWEDWGGGYTKSLWQQMVDKACELDPEEYNKDCIYWYEG